jgi:hypothetical protein
LLGAADAGRGVSAIAAAAAVNTAAATRRRNFPIVCALPRETETFQKFRVPDGESRERHAVPVLRGLQECSRGFQETIKKLPYH